MRSSAFALGLAHVDAHPRRGLVPRARESAHLDRALFAATARKLRARNIDGLLVIGDGSSSDIHSISAGFTVPVVYAYGHSDDAEDASFLHDGYGAGRLAGAHLASIGCRRIAHVTASEEDRSARDRSAGLSDALSDAGLALDPTLVFGGDWSQAWGREAAQRLVASGQEFDAVCCGNDTMATAVAGVLAEAGIRVPTDVAITGMDDLAGLTGQDDNSLTTIDLRLSALGDRAANYLADVIGGTEYTPGRHVEPARLVQGLSTAR